MGRYAFFSTDFEYKFAFATQESSDIRLFGGVVTTTKQDLNMGKYGHMWEYDKDLQTILKTLQHYVSDTDLTLPDFTQFEGSLDGTHKLRNYLDDNARTLYDWIGSDMNAYILGCLIYHQLTYEHTLHVGYEP